MSKKNKYTMGNNPLGDTSYDNVMNKISDSIDNENNKGNQDHKNVTKPRSVAKIKSGAKIKAETLKITIEFDLKRYLKVKSILSLQRKTLKKMMNEHLGKYIDRHKKILNEESDEDSNYESE